MKVVDQGEKMKKGIRVGVIINNTKGRRLSINIEEVSESSEMLLLELGASSRSSLGIGSKFMDIAGRRSRGSEVMDLSRTSFKGGGGVHHEEVEATI